jgi:hypothetical protein
VCRTQRIEYIYSREQIHHIKEQLLKKFKEYQEIPKPGDFDGGPLDESQASQRDNFRDTLLEGAKEEDPDEIIDSKLGDEIQILETPHQ